MFKSGDPAARAGLLPRLPYRRVDGHEREVRRRRGLKLQLSDLRSVIRRARAGGRRVILGGHSAGASTAVAYAAWDFGGRRATGTSTGSC